MISKREITLSYQKPADVTEMQSHTQDLRPALIYYLASPPRERVRVIPFEGIWFVSFLAETTPWHHSTNQTKIPSNFPERRATRLANSFFFSRRHVIILREIRLIENLNIIIVMAKYSKHPRFYSSSPSTHCIFHSQRWWLSFASGTYCFNKVVLMVLN